jgi:hypothetical protein
VPTIEEFFRERAGIEKFSRRWMLYFLFPTQKVDRVEASTEVLRIRDEVEENYLKERNR